MKLLMYSICDKQTSYMFPYPAYSDPAAIRNFAADINGNVISRDNPGDFDLFCVGSFDTETGMVEAYVPNKHVSAGMNVVRRDVEYDGKSE